MSSQPSSKSSPAASPAASHPSVNGWNPDLIESMYAQWKADPSSVEESWRTFFTGFDLGVARPVSKTVTPAATTVPEPAIASTVSAGAQSRVDELIRRYREFGHRCADLDPLGVARPFVSALALDSVGLDDSHLSESFDPGTLPLPVPTTLGTILDWLETTYCRHIGVEFMHIRSIEQREWLIRRMESVRNRPAVPAEQRRRIFEQVARADRLEAFLATRYVGKKRFGLEGGESTVPSIERVVELASACGTREIVMAMAHRGRVNLLANVVGKPYEQVLTEFDEACPVSFETGGGDVKYHQGYSAVREFGDGSSVHIHLCPNPSHLEFVNAVALGRTRALQDRAIEDRHDAVLTVLVHGDAAFPGQGSISECFNMMHLAGYEVGGAIHIVINNQVGFTTDPAESWGGEYCTDVARGFDVPVFHVNGDDPEACVWVTELAFDFRREFGVDTVVDIWCFRKNGHNETDEPSFTQPLLYQRVKAQTPVMNTYAATLVREGVLEEGQSQAFGDLIFQTLDAAQARAKSTPYEVGNPPFRGQWVDYSSSYSSTTIETGVAESTLARISKETSAMPASFTPHRTVGRVVTGRAGFGLNKTVDWSQAELLAYGSLALEGFSLRLSGQDTERGTFSHRHAVIVDQTTGQKHNVFETLCASPGAGIVSVLNSPLTENACVAFELGYSTCEPKTLIIWEAQFGDFGNGAQVIIDQFIAPGFTKWRRATGLVLLLPHGYEGQGPEHSSARLERFLQLYADHNLVVCHPTTTSQMFHLLRRQMMAQWRRPLICLTPKSMLRLQAAQSLGSAFVSGHFETVLDDPSVVDPTSITRLHLCSGKFYHELVETRQSRGAKDHAFVRMEQIAPFPAEELQAILARYPSATVDWVQEESLNLGAAQFVRDEVEALTGLSIRRIGRAPSASSATGSSTLHAKQSDELLDRVFSTSVASSNDEASSRKRVVQLKGTRGQPHD